MKGQLGKAPTVQWYFKDWLADKNLMITSASTRGIWINLLMYMYDQSVDDPQACTTGIIEASIPELCRLGGCTQEEAERFLIEASKHQFCKVALQPHGDHVVPSKMQNMVGSLKNVFIMSRRIIRECEQRAKWRDDKRKQREQADKVGGCPSDVFGSKVVPPIPSPSPTPYILKKAGGADAPAFLEIDIETIRESSLDKISEMTESMVTQLKTDGVWSNAQSFVTQHLNKQFSARAILLSLMRTYSKGKSAKHPWGYATNVLKVENGNFNELENARGYA